jgi:transcriptional regulator with XRE-family HTH domain
MISNNDFSWAEAGGRIRGRRCLLGMSQQRLADAAAITQNGIYRIEAGTTNPQLSTLRRIAVALGCSVRDLVVGIPENEPALADRFRSVRRVVESGDNAALRMLDGGIEGAEALLERSGRQRAMPSRRIIAKGEGRHDSVNDLLWQTRTLRRRSKLDAAGVVQPVQKAEKPFRNPSARNEAKSQND